MDHGEVVGGTLFVAGGDAAELLEAVDQALDEVAPPISRVVEVGLAALVAFAGDNRPDVPATQASAGGWAAVALVAGNSSRPQAGSAPSRTADRTPIQQCLERDLLVSLAAGQHSRDRSAFALSTEVQLRREPALAAAQRLPGLDHAPLWRRLGGRRRRADALG